MTKMEKIETQEYFSQIGAWPQATRRIGFAYVTGFVLSLIFTMAAYLLAVHHLLSEQGVLISVVVFAILQFIIQITCFFHLSMERASRERLIALICVAIIVAILIGGSLWIMQSLNQRMMPTTEQMQQYMNNQTGI
jgi:cytochrome o ubiquinol oxidase operon protein cyoD